VIEFSIRRSIRKTVGILVHPVRGVIISAHPNLSLKELRAIVLKRAEWIIRKQNLLKNSATPHPPKRFVEGEQLWYLGKQYPLRITNDKHDKHCKDKHSCPGASEHYCTGSGLLPTIAFSGEAFWIFLPPGIRQKEQEESLLRSALVRWYSAQAEALIRQRIEIYRPAVASSPPLIVRVRQQKCCWGSCTAKNALHFNWRLILSPLPIIDYVVVHELCHLKIKNHSRQFWSLVGSIIPDYKERRAWLRQNGRQLDI